MQQSGVAPIDHSLGGLEPGLPLVLAGGVGSGRTALCLELAGAALKRGERVSMLTVEPPELLVRQALSLGIDLEQSLQGGQLCLLELDPGAARSLQALGAEPLVEALRAEAPETQLWILDPITDLTREILDEQRMYALVRTLLADLGGPAASLVATAEGEALRENPVVERALQNQCGSFVSLSRHEDGDSVFQVMKARGAASDFAPIRFRVGANGGTLVDSPSPKASPKHAKILVVSDDLQLGNTLVGWLKEKWDVISATDGVEALSRVLSERPALILLSLRMARIPGREILLSMRQGGVNTPVLVVLDRNGRSSDRVGALVLGANDVISQPVERFELIHRVEAMLRLPSSDGPGLDREGQLFSPLDARRSRSLSRELFLERLQRADGFGEQCGADSCLLFIEAPNDTEFDAFVSAADATLRAEDALLAVTERSALVLLVATEVQDGEGGFLRLARRYVEQRGEEGTSLAWTVVGTREFDPQDTDELCKSLHQRLVPWSPASSG